MPVLKAPKGRMPEVSGGFMMRHHVSVSRNYLLFIIRDACYFSSTFFVSGTLIQLYLTAAGSTAPELGFFNALMQCVVLAGMILFSNYAERHPDAKTQCSRILLLFALCFLLYLPAVSLAALPGRSRFLLVCTVAAVQSIFCALKGILDFKLFYQIIPVSNLGTLFSLSGIFSGIASILFSWLISALIERFPFPSAFIAGFSLSFLFGCLAFYCNRKLVTFCPVKPETAEKPWVPHVSELFRLRVFSLFIIPNILRGISLGILSSIVIFAKHQGISSSNIARLAAVISLASIISSVSYLALKKKMDNRGICLIGSLLVAAAVFLPSAASDGQFLFLYAVAISGRTLVDNTIPAMVVCMIDSKIAGVYNAWRVILISLTAALSAYLTGILVGHLPAAVFFAVSGFGYLVSGGWYYHFYRRFENV